MASVAVIFACCVVSKALAAVRPRLMVWLDLVADTRLSRVLSLKRSEILVKRCVSTSFAGILEALRLIIF